MGILAGLDASRCVGTEHFQQPALLIEPYTDTRRDGWNGTSHTIHRVKPACFSRIARPPAIVIENHGRPVLMKPAKSKVHKIRLRTNDAKLFKKRAIAELSRREAIRKIILEEN